jgi:tRNA(Ile)-lysidine synthase
MYQNLRLEVLPQLIPANSGILIAVSGGPDSVALAHVIWRYIGENKDRGLWMAIDHVNHKVRSEAEAEAKMVQNLARSWQVPFILHEFKAKEYATKSGKSFQEAARQWRYARWQEDMKKLGLNLLATAHHLGDQAETVLYRVIRGTGTAGLAGIYPAKENIIRPFLSVSKKEILAYCHEQGLPYAIDKSNLEPCYDRNKIRIELLPELERSYNDRIQEGLARMAEILRWDEEFIRAQVDVLWPKYSEPAADKQQIKLSLEIWEQPEAILSRILRRAACMITGEPRGLEHKYIKTMMKNGLKIGWGQDFPGFKVKTERNGFFFFRRELGVNDSVEQALPDSEAMLSEVSLQLGKWHVLPGLNLRAGIFLQQIADTHILWSTEFDQRQLFALEKPMVCRIRQPGDKLFFRNVGHKTLKKVFQENNVPLAARLKQPVFAIDKSVVWIPGICRSDSFLPLSGRPKAYGFVAKK